LVETLDVANPVVVAVGNTTKTRVPLQKYLRAHRDRASILDCVRRSGMTRTSAQATGESGQTIRTDPIVGPSGLVHGVRVTVTTSLSKRPLARMWAFEWDLSRGLARRPKMLCRKGEEPRQWTLAEVFERVELGESTIDVLGHLVGHPSDAGILQFCASASDGISDERHSLHIVSKVVVDGKSKVLRGLTHDTGPIAGGDKSLYPPHLAELVADALKGDRLRCAVLDVTSMELVYWHGRPPSDIAWRLHERGEAGSWIHERDRETLHEALTELSSSPSRTPQINTTIRLRHITGEFGRKSVQLSGLTLPNQSFAVLLTFRLERRVVRCGRTLRK
jgi:hypothetical protein